MEDLDPISLREVLWLDHFNKTRGKLSPAKMFEELLEILRRKADYLARRFSNPRMIMYVRVPTEEEYMREYLEAINN